MLTRTLKMAFWIVYDHLGKLLVVNVFCMAVMLVPGGLAYAAAATGDPVLALAVGVPMMVLLTGVMAPVAGAGLAYMTKEFIDTREGQIRSFFTGVRRWGWRAAGLGCLYLSAGVCLGVSIWFYAVRVGNTVPVLGYALSSVALWCLVFLVFSGLLVLPALIQKGQGVLATAKLSALLVLDNPLFCFGLCLWCGMLAALSMVPLLLLCASLAPGIVLVSSAYEILSRKYAAVEAAGRSAWKRLPASEVFRDAEDDYLNRGFRDFLFPWKG